MVLDYHFKEVAVAAELDFFGNVVSDLFGARHALHELQVANLLSQDVLIGRFL